MCPVLHTHTHIQACVSLQRHYRRFFAQAGANHLEGQNTGRHSRHAGYRVITTLFQRQ